MSSDASSHSRSSSVVIWCALPSDDATPSLTMRLRDAINERGADDLPDNVPVGVLTDLLLQRAQAAMSKKER